MRFLIKFLITLLLALIACAIYERVRRRPARLRRKPPPAVVAYRFHSGLSFAEAAKLLRANGDLGKWYERDSAWYPELLSSEPIHGMKMDLHYFDGESVLEIKFLDADADRPAAHRFVIDTVLPALAARDVRPTQPVD